MTPQYIDAPAFWANYLINGDADNYSPDSIAEIRVWLGTECLRHADFADVGDEPSYAIFDFAIDGPLQTMILTYTYFLKDQK